MAELTDSQNKTVPILPTTVIGSYAYPSWLWTALEEMRQGKYGESDIAETLSDAVKIAIHDQEEAGIDIVNDGEMRRWYVFQSWYKRLSGLEPLEPLRKVGFYGNDSTARYRAVSRLGASRGLGIVEEFLYLKSHTQRPIKVTCTGPVTMTMPIELGSVYKDRIELAGEVAHVINAELKALAAAGADFIQIDEPSYALLPGSMNEWANLFNEAVSGVKAKIALHICFGSVGGRPGGKRSYRWMLPKLLDARADQFVLEFASRELKELELCRDFAGRGEVGVGVVDVKSLYVETPAEIAERLREALAFVDAEKLYVNPDCGFFHLPRGVAYQKMQNMVAGTQIVRREIGAK
ncbi:MAG TPA: methionine synthase [Candidatus Binatia bacterium]|jgi:5-methyltetrahydropteroyltriglutamate--homocysteine methyltransferase|nr:methionine synthase [Candidatus Binatia bacterium]